jgi:hypothetical protein
MYVYICIDIYTHAHTRTHARTRTSIDPVPISAADRPTRTAKPSAAGRPRHKRSRRYRLCLPRRSRSTRRWSSRRSRSRRRASPRALERYSRGYSGGTHRGTRGGTRGSLEEYSPLSLAPPIGPTPSFCARTHAAQNTQACARAHAHPHAPHSRRNTRAHTHPHPPLLLERIRAGAHDRAGRDTSDAQRAHVDPRGGKPHRRAVRWGLPGPQLRMESAHPATSEPGPGPPLPTSAPGLGSPPRHLHRDWALRMWTRCLLHNITSGMYLMMLPVARCALLAAAQARRPFQFTCCTLQRCMLDIYVATPAGTTGRRRCARTSR